MCMLYIIICIIRIYMVYAVLIYVMMLKVHCVFGNYTGYEVQGVLYLGCSYTTYVLHVKTCILYVVVMQVIIYRVYFVYVVGIQVIRSVSCSHTKKLYIGEKASIPKT